MEVVVVVGFDVVVVVGFAVVVVMGFVVVDDSPDVVVVSTEVVEDATGASVVVVDSLSVVEVALTSVVVVEVTDVVPSSPKPPLTTPPNQNIPNIPAAMAKPRPRLSSRRCQVAHATQNRNNPVKTKTIAPRTIAIFPTIELFDQVATNHDHGLQPGFGASVIVPPQGLTNSRRNYIRLSA